MRNFSIYLLLVFSFFSCKKDKLEGDKEILIGKWKWIYTIKEERSNCDNPTQFSTLTPLTENTEYRIEFVKKGIVTFFKNGEEVDKYRIVFNSDFELSDYAYFSNYYEFQIQLNNKEDKFFTGYVNDDTLIETGNWFPYKEGGGCVSYTSYFVRE